MLKELWKLEAQKHPNYSVQPNKWDWTEENKYKCCAFFNSEEFDTDLDKLLLVVYVLGRFVLLRGKVEHSTLEWDRNVSFGNYSPNHPYFASLGKFHLKDLM